MADGRRYPLHSAPSSPRRRGPSATRRCGRQPSGRASSEQRIAATSPEPCVVSPVSGAPLSEGSPRIGGGVGTATSSVSDPTLCGTVPPRVHDQLHYPANWLGRRSSGSPCPSWFTKRAARRARARPSTESSRPVSRRSRSSNSEHWARGACRTTSQGTRATRWSSPDEPRTAGTSWTIAARRRWSSARRRWPRPGHASGRSSTDPPCSRLATPAALRASTKRTRGPVAPCRRLGVVGLPAWRKCRG